MPAALPDAAEIRAIVREELGRALASRPGPDLLTTEEAAAAAGVTPKTVRGWVAAGLTVRILTKRTELWKDPSVRSEGA